MLKHALSSFARDIKTKDALERFALPPGRAAEAVLGALKRFSAPVRGAIPVSLRGLPEGLRQEELDAVFLEHFHDRPFRTAFVHLTGWKTSWVQRVFVRTESGARRTLVYKHAAYNDELVPAVRDLPVRPGPPEHAVYCAARRNPESALAGLLPLIFLTDEVEPGCRYRYLLEDLGTRFRRLERTDATLRIARALPNLHRALAELPLERRLLLNYDGSFRTGLLTYAEDALTRYAGQIGSRVAETLLASWDEITAAYPTGPPHPELEGPIHGDPNVTNVLFDREEVRFIDWEWAGIGLPHMDLAAVVKGAPVELEEEALRAFIRSDRRLADDEHRRLYLICKLERGLIDGAFLAIQSMEAAGKAPFDIDGPLRRALATARILNN